MDDQIEALVAKCAPEWVVSFTGSPTAYRRTEKLIQTYGRPNVVKLFEWVHTQDIRANHPMAMATTALKTMQEEGP